MLKNKFIYAFLLIVVQSTSVFSASQIDSLYNLVDSTKIDTIQIDILIKISNELRNSDYKQTLILASKALKMSENLNDEKRKAKCLFIIGTSYSNMGLTENAFDKLLECKNLFLKQKDTIHLIKTLSNIGNLFWFKQDYEIALKHYQKARNLSYKSNYTNNLNAINTNIGISLNKINKHDSAIVYLREALHDVQKKNDKYGLGMVNFNIRGHFENLNQYDSTEYYYQQTIKYIDALPHQIISILYSSNANTNIKLKRNSIANESLKKAYQYANSNGNLHALHKYYEAKFIFDTATHNYKTAIQTHIKLKQIKDSIYTKEFSDITASYLALYELSQKEIEIQKLKLENSTFRLNARKNQILIVLFVVISLLTTITIMLVSRSNQAKKKAISELHKKNNELKNHKEELSTLNEEICIQREELFKKNKELELSIRRLKKAQIQIIHSEKLATIGVLASGVAHEINNPLNFINAGLIKLQDIKSDNDTTNEILQACKIIEDGVQRASSITHMLGSLVTPTKQTPQPTELNKIINTTLKFINYRISDNIKLFKKFGSIPKFNCFPDKIQAIVLHLVTNAVDATDDINLENKNKYIKITTWTSKIFEKNKVFIRVENSGRNLSQSTLKKIFDPFFTTKDQGKGSGLGLYLVYNLVNELKGSIQVNNIDGGVEFLIEIPFT